MRAARKAGETPAQHFAHTACLCMSLALVMWTAGSWVALRLALNQPLGWDQIEAYGLVLLVAVLYFGLHILIRQDRTWALKTAFVLSLVLFTTALGGAVVLRIFIGNTYLIVLSLATAAATYLAMESPSQRAHRNSA